MGVPRWYQQAIFDGMEKAASSKTHDLGIESSIRLKAYVVAGIMDYHGCVAGDGSPLSKGIPKFGKPSSQIFRESEV